MEQSAEVFSTTLRKHEIAARRVGRYELSNWLSECAAAVEAGDRKLHISRRFPHGNRKEIDREGRRFYGLTHGLFSPKAFGKRGGCAAQHIEDMLDKVTRDAAHKKEI